MSEYQPQTQPQPPTYPQYPNPPGPPVAPPRKVKKPRGRVVVPLIVGAVTFFIGLGVGLAGGGGTENAANPQPGTTKVVTVPAAPAVTSAPAAVRTFTLAPAPPPAVTIEDGVWTVGSDIPAGKYRVTEPIAAETDCYWAIIKSGTNGEDIIANGLPTGGRPTVTLKAGQDFNTERCGTWQKIG
jgi:hypothetical protein